ncbi:MAG: acyloxyacyl hydrolase [Flavobacteriales bacterium]
MKIASLVLLLTLSYTSNSQIVGVEFSPMFGYTISGTANYDFESYSVKDGPSFGGLINIEVYEGSNVEFSYTRVNTEAVKLDYFSGYTTPFELGIEQYHIGVTQEFADGKIQPFVNVSIGAVHYFELNRTNIDYNSGESWNFSTSFGLGTKLYINDFLGFRIQTSLGMPMESDGFGLFCGFGTGGASCGGGWTLRIPIVHWNMGAGLIIRIPQ